ncbi:MAG: hypothetical protein ACOY0T_03495 [Myxococcota bacterium]
MRRIQQRLERFYALELGLDVVDFVHELEDESRREALLIREAADAIEVALLLPKRVLEAGTSATDADSLMQALEGVSHFVYLSERVRTGLPTTKLELELQAEVDKFVLLALEGQPRDFHARHAICEKLFERVSFLHDAGSEDGERYRLANALAARFVRRLDPGAGVAALRERLRRFYRAGQAEKIHLARAA